MAKNGFQKGTLTPEALGSLQDQLNTLRRESRERERNGKKPLKKTEKKIIETDRKLTERVAVIVYHLLKKCPDVGVSLLRQNFKFALLGIQPDDSRCREATDKLTDLLNQNKNNPELNLWHLVNQDVSQITRQQTFFIVDRTIFFKDMGGHIISPKLPF